MRVRSLQYIRVNFIQNLFRHKVYLSLNIRHINTLSEYCTQFIYDELRVPCIRQRMLSLFTKIRQLYYLMRRYIRIVYTVLLYHSSSSFYSDERGTTFERWKHVYRLLLCWPIQMFPYFKGDSALVQTTISDEEEVKENNITSHNRQQQGSHLFVNTLWMRPIVFHSCGYLIGLYIRDC